MINKLTLALLLIPLFIQAQIAEKTKKIKTSISHAYYFKLENGKVVRQGKAHDSYYQETSIDGHHLSFGHIGSDNILWIQTKNTYSKTGLLLAESIFNKEGLLLGTRQLSYDSLERITLYKATYPNPLTKTFIYDRSGYRVVINFESSYYGNSKEIHYFDSLRRVVREERFDGENKRYDIRLHRFDTAGNEIENLLFSNDSILILGRRYNFNGNSFPVEEYINEGKQWNPVFKARTVNGLIAEQTDYEDGKLKSKRIITYNSKKLEIKSRLIAKGKPDYIILTKYDDHNKTLEILKLNGSKTDAKYTFKYRYNEWGDVVYQEMYIDNGPVELSEFEYVYY